MGKVVSLYTRNASAVDCTNLIHLAKELSLKLTVLRAEMRSQGLGCFDRTDSITISFS